MVRDPLARSLAEVNGGVQLEVCTRAPLSRISGTAGRFALKFCVWLGNHCVLHRMEDIYTSAHITVRTFKHIYSFLLVCRRKGVLLVKYSVVSLHRAVQCAVINPRGGAGGLKST